MSLIKDEKEINFLREGGAILADILRRTAALALAGVSTFELDKFAEKEILKSGGTPAFKNYGDKRNPFPAALCTSINSEIVHGIPSKKIILREGDIVSLDIGMKYKGLYTDTALTVGVGKISAEAQRLLQVTEKARDLQVAAVCPGRTIGDIGHVAQKYIEGQGFAVVRDLVGHGIGYQLHEEPQVPSYGQPGRGAVLKERMVIAIEPMVTAGKYSIIIEDDGWTICTADNSLAAHFEHTIIVTKTGAEVLTK